MSLCSQGDLCPSMHHKSHDQGSLSRGISVWGSLSRVSLSRGSLSRGSLSRRGLCLGVSVWRPLSRDLCPGRSLSQGVSVQGVPVQGGVYPGGSLLRGYLSGGLCPGGLSRGVSVWGVSVQGVSVRETPLYGNERMVCILLECILVHASFTPSRIPQRNIFQKTHGFNVIFRTSRSYSSNALKSMSTLC